MNPILSVVIPVYKVEDYLVRCVKSVLNQDFTELEVILVDDGSPDRCPQMCDELAKTDERIVVIHKPNGGLSSARNAGIERSRGEYLAFLDSDDQWAPNQLSLLMESVIESKAQMAIYSSKSLYENGDLYKRDDNVLFGEDKKSFTALNLYPILIQSGDLHESACTKILKTTFLRDNNLTFKSGILGEDTEWMFRLLRLDASIFLIHIPLFICTENRAGSISNTASTKSVKDTLSTIRTSIDYYKQSPSAPTKDYELAHCAYLWSIALGHYNYVGELDKKDVKKEIIEIGNQLDLTAHPKSKKVGMIYKLLGFNVTAYVLSIYIKLHKKNIVNKKIKVNG